MERVAREDFLRAVEADEIAELDRLPDGLVLDEGVVFSTPGERGLRLDLYDLDRPPVGPRPAILFVHGGGWCGGTRKQFARQAAYLTSKHGFVSACCEYRFSHEARFPACLQDVKCAIRHLRARADELGIDPERIAVAGGSAGGHLAALAATTAGVDELEGDGGYAGHSSRANLSVPHNPALDLTPLARRAGEAFTPVRELIGGTPDEMPERYRAASPFHRAGPATPPMLLLHGDADATLPCKQSIAMHERLLRLGVAAEIELYANKGHGWFNRAPDFAPVLKRVEAFLVKHFCL